MGATLFRNSVIAGFAWLALPGAAIAEDNQAGTPLVPAEAAGVWTLQSAGHAICTVTLKADKAGDAGFGLARDANCGEALPATAAGWSPTGDGMAINGSDGKVVLAFNRWSNSLFVSHRASGADLQLKRGAPAD